ncbi:hypothetical protein F7725_005267 [Dissostichus mawsoni]|uniref:Uncharacterized protein n=1 Tax=Dissostichus mawsoni TaxID=36200 RepID=A0A7J5YQR6_DISMA|nr:hypothetical protein F7725_005267 [Dissostichus mawsoni]
MFVFLIKGKGSKGLLYQLDLQSLRDNVTLEPWAAGAQGLCVFLRLPYDAAPQKATRESQLWENCKRERQDELLGLQKSCQKAFPFYALSH